MNNVQKFRLTSDDLINKYGFADGDIFDELLFGVGFDDIETPADWALTFNREVLARVVERYLLPELDPRPETERICTTHNPIRVTEEWTRHPEMLSDMEVFVTADDVLQVAEALKAQLSPAS